jgi:hypothetical protein
MYKEPDLTPEITTLIELIRLSYYSSKTMDDFTSPLTLIDVRNTGFIGMDMLNKANVGPINPEKCWLVLWQEGRKDENGNDVPTSVSNVAILEKEVVVNELLKCLMKYGLSKEFEITNNVLEHPKVWRIWDEALKRYERIKQKTIK